MFLAVMMLMIELFHHCNHNMLVYDFMFMNMFVWRPDIPHPLHFWFFFSDLWVVVVSHHTFTAVPSYSKLVYGDEHSLPLFLVS